MSKRYFGRAADVFGLVAYWTVMYGRLPDRNTLAELYTQASGTLLAERERSHLTIVPGSGDQPAQPARPERSIDAAA